MRILLPLCLAALTVHAADEPALIVANVEKQLLTGDRYWAIEYIQRQGTPVEVTAVYSGLTRYFLQRRKDLDRFVFFSRAGIHYALTMAQTTDDDAQVDALRSAAKTLAYDLAAETWPGWGEGGVTPTPEQTAIGHDAARLNWRLARELKKGALREAYAHWMLGAHELAAGLHDQAAANFRTAEEKATEADSPATALSARGFLAVTRIVAGQEAEGLALLEEVRAALAARAEGGDEEAAFLATQFDPALAAFRRPR